MFEIFQKIQFNIIQDSFISKFLGFTFYSILQISASQTKSSRSLFCNFSAYFILGSFVYLIITDLNIPLKNTSVDCVWKQKYDLFNTLKKLVFILVLLQEGILFLFIFSSISFWDVVNQQLDYEKLLIFGWIQMGLLSFVLLVNLLGKVKEIFLILKHFFSTKIQCKCQIKKSQVEEKENINSSQIGDIFGSVGLQHTPQSIYGLVVSSEQINPNQAQVTFAAQLTPNFESNVNQKVEL